MTQRRDSGVLGRIPSGVTHWSVRRKESLTWEWCTFASPDGVAMQEFPIGDLTVGTIRKRWGPGTYRVMFLALARGVRQVFGNGKIFELTSSGERSATPRPTGPAGRGAADAAAAAAAAPDDHSDMVRALLRGAEGKRQPYELFEALAIPMGMGLSSLFAAQDRVTERLEALERRLASIEHRLGASPVDAPSPPPRGMDRILEKLESIEARLAPTAQPGQALGRLSPPGRRRSPTPR